MGVFRVRSLLLGLELWAFLSSAALARITDNVVNHMARTLMRIPADYFQDGSVEEEIARLQFYQRFPISKFEIVRGIQYHINGMTAGELDIVVFSRATGMAVFVGEVKSGASASAAQKANSQLARFRTAIAQDQVDWMDLRSNINITFDPGLFTNNWQAATIGLAGRGAHHFDIVLKLSKDQLLELTRSVRDEQTRAWKTYQRENNLGLSFEQFLAMQGSLETFNFATLVAPPDCSGTFANNN